MNMEINDHIAVFENCLSERVCNNMIEWFDQKSDNVKHNEIDFLNRDDYEIVPLKYKSFVDNFYDDLFSLLHDAYEQYRHEYMIEGNPIPSPLRHAYDISKFKMQMSVDGGGFCCWHSEWNTDSTMTNRFLVWMIYLNDVEEGGRTEFMNGQSFQPKAGTLLLWPAYFTHMHRASSDLVGKKYILTGWYNYTPQSQED